MKPPVTRKSISFPAATHEAWAAAAKAEGLSLAAWVAARVEAGQQPHARSLRGVEVRPARAVVTPPMVRPQECTARLPKGTWCKRCGSTHKVTR